MLGIGHVYEATGMENIVYAKSNKGEQEIQFRTFGLRPTLRRVLLLIDGKRATAELMDFVRPDELREILAELLADDFVEPLEELSDIDPRVAGWPRTADDETHFNSVKRHCVIHMHKCLGLAALPAIDRVQAADDPVSIRRALRDIEPIIAGITGDAEAKEFCRRVGRAIMRKIEVDALLAGPLPAKRSGQDVPMLHTQALQPIELTTTGKVRALEQVVDDLLAEAAQRTAVPDSTRLARTMRIFIAWKDRFTSTPQRTFRLEAGD